MITKKQVCFQSYHFYHFNHFKGLDSKQIKSIRDPFSLARLAESNYSYFRISVSLNKHLPLACALKLIQGEDYSTRLNLAETIKNKTVLQILARDESTSISLAARISLARLREQ